MKIKIKFKSIRFKLRYHPDENFKRRNEHNQFILNRLDVFLELMNQQWLDNVSIESDKAKDIIKFLDAGNYRYSIEVTYLRQYVSKIH